MERMFKKFLSVAALLSAVTVQATTTPVLTYFKARSHSFNGAIKVANEVGKVHLYDQDSWYGNFSVTPGYERSFRSSKIADCLFGGVLGGDKDCRTLKIQGSDLGDDRDTTNALLADYFYLPIDYSSTVTFSPRISKGFIDFNFYLGLDEWWQGSYLRVYAPFVHSKWDLNMKETVVDAGDDAHPAAYFTPGVLGRDNLLSQATNFFAGEAPSNVGDVTFRGLCFAKINGSDCDTKCGSKSGSRTENRFGEIRAELGWNFWQNDDYHLGINLQAAAPTGSSPKADYLFDAVVGNGKHWELGAGATGHYTFWRGCDDYKHFSINMDLSVLHLFGARQQRTFDLAGKPLSRYMLASKFRAATDADVIGVNSVTDAQTAASHVFDNEYSPVANLTTQDVKVTVGAQVDFTAWFNFTSGGFSGDLGYNLWYSSCEKFRCHEEKCPTTCCDVTFAENTWALKGNAAMFGFAANSVDGVPLSASNSAATILNGNAQGDGFFDPGTDSANGTVDNAQLAISNPALLPLNNQPNQAPDTSAIATSIQTVFIKQSDLDSAISSAPRSRGLSHKIFGHLAYSWDRAGWVPYLGAGVSAEFGKTEGNGDDCKPAKTSSNCSTKCDDCLDCAVSQWGVWVKTGFSF